MQKIELLAPAKDLECGISAINSGADAIYIGGPSFGARKAAGNSLEDIEKLINYAHKFYAKVYITINTILTNKELSEAQKLIEKLYDLKADAIIIQDTGLLELSLPPIPIIASTQMHNNTVEKVQFLEKVGFKRVILPREFSLDDISKMLESTSIELECFIHGALCVSYSGQCYLSYAIGGRSGNRGECAQPCRRKYSLIDSKDNIIAKDLYLLSLKDFNLSKHLEKLIKAGITSFKIEGRLKDSAYINNVVSYYRKEIDNVLDKLAMNKVSSGKSLIEFSPDLFKTFNRGYTTYFIDKRSKDIASPYTPKSLGEKIGRVIQSDKKLLIIETQEKLSPGDGICFFDENKVLQGSLINRIDSNKIYLNEPKTIPSGEIIYRNLDSKFIKCINDSKIERKIGVKFCLNLHNSDLKLIAIDEDANEATGNIKINCELAKSPDTVLNNLKKNLSKLGETDFYLDDLSINLDEVYFIPVKDINELRRQTISRLEQVRKFNLAREEINIVPNNVYYPEKNLDYSFNVFNDKAVQFYKRHGVKNIELAAETQKDMSGKKVMTTKHCLKYQFDGCFKYKREKELNEPLYLIDEHGKKLKLNFDCDKCQMEVFY